MDHAPPATEPGPAPPERVGRYEILLPIASGGMATVYLARARGVGGFEREVALKLTHSHLRHIPEFANDLIEEAKLAARIRHPNVVPVIDVGEDPLGLFLVMEYVEGDTLSALLRRATASGELLPREVTLRIAVDALAGLHAAHELQVNGQSAGVVHRDVSPQNILVGTDGVTRLTDFGIAKAATRLGHTHTGHIKGKIGYMSPEQARGQPLDRRSDVWAAGVVIWELLAGRKLHPIQNEVSTLLKIVTELPPRLGSIVPDLSEDIDQAVAHALTMAPNERCPTAQQLGRSLTNAWRAQGQLAEIGDVAECVKRLIGPKLEERNTRVRAITDLRSRMGQLASAAPDPAVLTPPSGSQAAPVGAPGCFKKASSTN